MRVYYWSDSENRVVSLHLLEQIQNFCLYVVGKVPKGILKQGSLRRTWWRAVVAEQIVERTHEHLAHFVRIGLRRVALAVDIRVMSAGERRHGIPLREAGHAPAADR